MLYIVIYVYLSVFILFSTVFKDSCFFFFFKFFFRKGIFKEVQALVFGEGVWSLKGFQVVWMVLDCFRSFWNVCFVWF